MGKRSILAEIPALPIPARPARASMPFEHCPPRQISFPIAFGGSAACDGEAGTPAKQTTHRPFWGDSALYLGGV